MDIRDQLEHTYLAYIGGEVFKSRLCFGRDNAFLSVLEMIFGEGPAPETEEWDEFVSLKNDFENESFWREGGALWEADFSTGFAVVVRVESRLN